MKARIFGITAAVLFHAALILFGGLFFLRDKQDHGTLQTVDLLAAEDPAKKEDEKQKDKPKDQDQPPDDEQVETQTEQAPDASEVIRNLEMTATAAPALEAASLGAIEAALSGAGGGGSDFADALTFASGGRIGGTGKDGAIAEDKLDQAFSMAEIDQRPRVIFQAAPTYPAEMRAQKTPGFVEVVFIVDQTGRVASARTEKSSHPAFEKPAVDAVKQWKFEPAIKGGQRVQCKMRAPIRFQPS